MPHPRPSPPLCPPSRLRPLCSLCAVIALQAARAEDLPPRCPDMAAADMRLASASGFTRPAADTPVEASSDVGVFSLGNGNASLHGNVVVRQGEREVRAQNADYDAATRSFSVKGAIEYQDPLVHLSGTDGQYSATGGASFKSAQFELRQRAARGFAQSVDITPSGILHLQGVTFTTCPASDQSWQLKADTLTLDTTERIGNGRDTSVDFQGVPILYLPWLSFPLGNERKSGFLFPSIGNSTRSGVQLSIPYYWNIAPNADLTLDPLYYSRRGIDLGGDARYLTENQTGELEWHYLPGDHLAGGNDRSLVSLKQVTQLPDDFRLRINAENVSDSHYFEDFAQGPEGTSTAFVERLAELTYRDEHWNFAAQVQQYQTIDLPLEFTDPSDLPYARLPRLTASGSFGFGPSQVLHYGFDSELVDFTRADHEALTGVPNVTGWRLDVSPNIGLAFDGPGYFARPAVAWRFTQYALENVAPGSERSPSRTLPIASFDTGLLFERNSSAGRTLTLEPRLLYLYVPYRNQDELPVFDTALPDLNLVELFRTNRYVGADRVSDANQLSAGVTSRLVDSSTGQQFLAATLGQTYYFDSPRVTLPEETPISTPHSDLVAELALTAYKHWNVDVGLQWDPNAGRSDRTFVQLQFKPAAQSVINLAYRFQRNSLDQAEVSGAWPVARDWNAYTRLVYDLSEHKSLDSFAGFEYGACCWKVRFLARRFLRTATGQQDTGIFLQLELTGLASVGSQADTFLGTAIRGYSRSVPTR